MSVYHVSNGGVTVIGVYVVIQGCLSWIGNGVVILLLTKQRKCLEPQDFLTLNLAISHASISILGYFLSFRCFLGSRLSYKDILEWQGGWIPNLISINTLTAISVMVCSILAKPTELLYLCIAAHHVNKRNICLVIAAVWLCSLFWAGAVTEVSLILCAAFLLPCSPYAVISMWSAWGCQIPPLNSILASLFTKSASFYNPSIYIGMSSKLRKDLQALFCCLRPTSAHRHTPPVLLARPSDLQLDVDGFKEDELVDPNASEKIQEGKSESPPESEHQERPLRVWKLLMRKPSDSGRL